MSEVEYYKVDYFLLADEFKEEGVEGNRVSFCIKTPLKPSREAHENYVNEILPSIEALGDDHGVSYRLTSKTTKSFSGSPYHVTVVNFRVRDSY